MGNDVASDASLRVVRGSQATTDTAQSAGALRVAGIGTVNTPATRIWLGKLSNEPGHHSVAHHHGDAETAAYVLKGSARIHYGPDYRDHVDLEEGDFLFVPSNFPHIESNRSDTDELVWLTARSPDNIVVNLEDEPRPIVRD
jgi:uncharacterized RmlC-like cupin family protein